MGEHTGIRWTDHTFNPWWGCVRVSEACQNCYAEALAARFGTGWGKHAPRRFFEMKHWNEPLRWDRKAEKAGKPALVFCASMADVFEDHPDLPEQRERLWDLIRETPWLTWQLLTKRPQNIGRMVPLSWFNGFWPKNVWVGTTVETQRWAEERLPHLVTVPAPVRFVSAEPLFGHLNLSDYLAYEGSPGVNWVIAGGESGPKARPSHPQWFRNLRDTCAALNVPFLFKQWGEYISVPVEDDPGFCGGRAYDDPRGGRAAPVVRDLSQKAFTSGRTRLMEPGDQTRGGTVLLDADTIALKVGKKAAGWVLDGRTHDEIPPTVPAR